MAADPAHHDALRQMLASANRLLESELSDPEHQLQVLKFGVRVGLANSELITGIIDGLEETMRTLKAFDARITELEQQVLDLQGG